MTVLSGKQPDVDIPIIFTGLRPGERLFEEILGTKEETEKIKFDKFFKAKNMHIGSEAEILSKEARLIECAERGDCKDTQRYLLLAIVSTYVPDANNCENEKW